MWATFMSVFMLDGKLVSCNRTPEGVEAVASGKVQLNARQRQFWLVVGKTDTLNQRICEKLAESINIGAFIEAGLLAIENSVDSTKKVVEQASETPVDINPFNVLSDEDKVQIKAAAALHEKHDALNREDELLFVDKVKAPQKSVDVTEVDTIPMSVRFDWVKSTMCSSLKQTSGLLATDLIESIERAENVLQLRRYTARWRTTMLDSRYDRAEIDVWLEQVKYALRTILE